MGFVAWLNRLTVKNNCGINVDSLRLLTQLKIDYR